MVDNTPNSDRERDRRDATGAPVVRNRWLPWVIGGVVLLLLLLALRSCGDKDADDTAVVTDNAASAPSGTVTGTVAATGAAGAGAASAWDRTAFSDYLAGNEPVGRAFALERVTFASGSVLLNADAKAQVGEVAAALKARPTARVSLRGYADPAGDAAANQALSEQRTNAVKNALVAAGAGKDQVAAASALGETGDAAIEANRRVEITVTAR